MLQCPAGCCGNPAIQQVSTRRGQSGLQSLQQRCIRADGTTWLQFAQVFHHGLPAASQAQTAHEGLSRFHMHCSSAWQGQQHLPCDCHDLDFMLHMLQSAPLKHRQQHASVPLKRVQQQTIGLLKLIRQCTSALLNHAKQYCLTTTANTAVHTCATEADTAALPDNRSSVLRLPFLWALAVQTFVLISSVHSLHQRCSALISVCSPALLNSATLSFHNILSSEAQS